MRGPAVRGARGLARGGVLEQYGEHGKQALRSNDGPILCFGRQPARNARSVRTACMRLLRRALKASLLAASVLTLSALPIIYPGGVVNGAGFLPPPLPGSALAPGSVVSIFGTNLGPEPGVAASGGPLPTELADVSVSLWNGEELSRPARLLYVGSNQINAVLGEDIQAGLYALTVRVGDETSPPVPIKVVASSFGIFTRRLTHAETGFRGRLPAVALVGNLTPGGRTVLNSPATPARLGGTIELWGAGLGRRAGRPEISATEHGDIEVDIGGRLFAIESAQAAACCPGVDRIRLRVPAAVPLGCFVPLSVRLRGVVYSNVETVSISEDGSPCEDFPPNDRPAEPRQEDLVTLSRSVVNGETFDEAEARFGPMAPTFRRLPAPGTCLPGSIEVDPEVSAALDAGSELSLSTPGGAILLPAAPAGEPPRYSVTSPPAPLFLGPGEYMLVGGGGSDVRAFSASISIPASPIWAAPSESEIVRRSRGFDVSWGAAEGSEILLTLTGGWGLTCRGAGAAGLSRLPAAILTNLPASARLPRGSERLEFVATFAPREARFTAEGIDEGRLRAVHREARDVVLSPLELSSTPVTFPNGEVIQAELATAFSERQRGLMGRPELGADRGMLFLFERPGRLTFWMFGVLIPLDLVWLDSDRRIVGLSERTPVCESGSTCPLFDGGAEAQFVLELAAGTAEANGLAIGDAIDW